MGFGMVLKYIVHDCEAFQRWGFQRFRENFLILILIIDNIDSWWGLEGF